MIVNKNQKAISCVKKARDWNKISTKVWSDLGLPFEAWLQICSGSDATRKKALNLLKASVK